jgi:hypothetical protein
MLFGIIAACFPVFFIGPETVYEYSPFLALLFSTIGAGKDFFIKFKQIFVTVKN